MVVVVPRPDRRFDCERSACPPHPLLGGPQAKVELSVIRRGQPLTVESHAIVGDHQLHDAPVQRNLELDHLGLRVLARIFEQLLGGTEGQPFRLRRESVGRHVNGDGEGAAPDPPGGLEQCRPQAVVECRGIQVKAQSARPRDCLLHELERVTEVMGLPVRRLSRLNQIELHGGGGHHLDGVVMQLRRNLGPLAFGGLVELALKPVPLGLGVSATEPR